MTEFQWIMTLPDPAAQPEAVCPVVTGHLMKAAILHAGFEKVLAELLGEFLSTGAYWTRTVEPPAVAVIQSSDGQRLCVDHPKVISPERWAAAAAIFSAVLEMRHRYDALDRLACSDHLTGLYNRMYFEHLTDALLQFGKQPRFKATLLLLDLDNFKQCNDSLGHAVGDEILCELANVIRRITRRHDLVARLGGDEFAVLFWDLASREEGSSQFVEPEALAERIHRVVEKGEFQLLKNRPDLNLSFSGGMAHFPQHGHCCRDLLNNADAALLQAKSDGKRSIYVVGQEGHNGR